MFPHLLSLRIEVQKVKHVGKYVQPWTLMLLIYTMYNSLSLHLPTLLQRPCLRRWNHSSMSLFWNAIVLTGDQAQPCKSRYLSCEKRETLRSTRQSTKQFDLPSLTESCEKREMLCQRGMLARQESTLP